MPLKPPFFPYDYPSSSASWTEMSADAAKALAAAVLRSTRGSKKGNTLSAPPSVSLIDIEYREHFRVGPVWEIKKDTAGWPAEDPTRDESSRNVKLKKGSRFIQRQTARDARKNRLVLGESEAEGIKVWFRRGDAKSVNWQKQWGLRGDLTFKYRQTKGGITERLEKQFKVLTVWERWKRSERRWTDGMMTVGPGTFAGYVKAMPSHSDAAGRKKFPSIWVIWQWDEKKEEWVEGVYRVKNPDSTKRSKGVFFHPGHTPSHFLGCLSPGKTETEWGFEDRAETQTAMWEILNDIGVSEKNFKQYPRSKEAKWFLIRVSDPRNVTGVGPGVLPEKVAVDGVVRNGNLEVCRPGSFEVVWKGPVTDADKKKVTWEVRDKATGTDLSEHDAVKPQADKLEIECVPFDWHETEVDVFAYLPDQPNKPHITSKVGAAELYEYIKLVRTAEQAHPNLSGEDLLNSLRWVAGYDNENFRDFFGGIDKAKELKPSGPLTQGMIDRMQELSRHQEVAGVEKGIAKDPLGFDVALGHVLTGMSAGQHPHTRDIPGPFGDPMDNLYGVTISGDLGQSAVLVDQKKATSYIGPGSEASYAELVGDIDGWLIGKHLRNLSGSAAKMNSAKVSDVLLAYYCSCSTSGTSMLTRFQKFKDLGMSKLKTEVWAFATTYKYAYAGRVAGALGTLDDHPDKACSRFERWLDIQVAGETERNKALD
jgi:hypothetical protein